MKLHALILAALLLTGASASAAAPQPVRRVDPASYSGRWYEIARTPNRFQRHCALPYVDYTRDGLKVRAEQHCSAVGGRSGHVWRSAGHILDPGINAKVRLTFLGFWSQDYWIVDNDPGAGWALVGDPGGRFIWVMARAADPGAAVRDEAISRARALGYDVGRLEYAGAR